jgi:hypothetical protein
MSPAAAKVLQFDSPETAKQVGAEMALTTTSLVTRLRSEQPIADVVALEQVVEDRKQIGDAIKRVEAFFAPFKQMANAMHKALCAREAEILKPLTLLDQTKVDAMRVFKIAQDRLREERERVEAEERRRDEQARAAAEAAALETSGDHELAAAVLEEAIAAPPPVVALPDVTKGVASFTRRWHWKFTGGPKLDPKNLLKDTPPLIVARSMVLIPREYLCVDVVKVNAYVTAMKGTAKIPGLEIFYTDTPTR